MARHPASKLLFVLYGYNSLLKYNSIEFSGQIEGIRHILYMDFLALENFLASEYQWHIRTTYDCYVNIKNFEEYIEQILEMSPDNLIIKGQVLNHSHDTIFVHGGSGWLLSRSAAQKMYDSKERLLVWYNQHPNWGDDLIFDEFAPRICNLSIDQIDDPRYMGPPTKESDLVQLLSKNYSFPYCPTPDQGKQWISVNKLVFWHVGAAHNYQLLHGDQFMEEVPDKVKIIGHHFTSDLCISTD